MSHHPAPERRRLSNSRGIIPFTVSIASTGLIKCVGFPVDSVGMTRILFLCMASGWLHNKDHNEVKLL